MLRASRKQDGAPQDHPTKRRLADETARRIIANGIQEVKVDEVLEAVGVTEGSLYYHFGSVNDMLVAGLLHAFRSAIEESMAWTHALREDCNSAKEARDRLRQIIDVSQVPDRRNMRSVRLQALAMARTYPSLAKEISRAQADLTDMMTEVNHEFQRRGWTNPKSDPRALAILIQAMNLGRIVDDVVDDDHRVDPSAWIALYDDVLTRFFIVDE